MGRRRSVRHMSFFELKENDERLSVETDNEADNAAHRATTAHIVALQCSGSGVLPERSLPSSGCNNSWRPTFQWNYLTIDEAMKSLRTNGELKEAQSRINQLQADFSTTTSSKPSRDKSTPGEPKRHVLPCVKCASPEHSVRHCPHAQPGEAEKLIAEVRERKQAKQRLHTKKLHVPPDGGVPSGSSSEGTPATPGHVMADADGLEVTVTLLDRGSDDTLISRAAVEALLKLDHGLDLRDAPTPAYGKPVGGHLVVLSRLTLLRKVSVQPAPSARKTTVLGGRNGRGAQRYDWPSDDGAVRILGGRVFCGSAYKTAGIRRGRRRPDSSPMLKMQRLQYQACYVPPFNSEATPLEDFALTPKFESNVVASQRVQELLSRLEGCCRTWAKCAGPTTNESVIGQHPRVHEHHGSAVQDVGGDHEDHRQLKEVQTAEDQVGCMPVGTRGDRHFNNLKVALARITPLAHPRADWDVCLFTDASAEYWGAVATQIPPGDLEKPRGEQRHEPLAFLSGKFDLIYIFNSYAVDAGIHRYQADKLQRWALGLSCFNYEIEHVSGEGNVWGDLLSRRGAHRDDPPPSTLQLRQLAIVDQIAPLQQPDIEWPTSTEIRHVQDEAIALRAPDDVALDSERDLYVTNTGKVWLPHDAWRSSSACMCYRPRRCQRSPLYQGHIAHDQVNFLLADNVY
ncbi:unnamed protein product [Phytophthora fragariaefolia]|uniref:Unnamed protein product n=1 Tax=Phytophthora fragariaefolia TaxID=1490495 RepID=A0A9W6YEQ5_9STRA|nr:unnamed protein product [Phytophthora fragariaefolia]